MPNNIPDSTQALYSRLAPSKASDSGQECYGQWTWSVRIEQGIVYLHTRHCPSSTQKVREKDFAPLERSTDHKSKFWIHEIFYGQKKSYKLCSSASKVITWTQASKPHRMQTNVNCIRSPPASDMKPFLVLARERQMKFLPREGFRIDMETSSSSAKLKTCPKKSVESPTQAWHIFFIFFFSRLVLR